MFEHWSIHFFKQIFTLLWFWYLIVIICTVYDLFIWLYRLFVRRQLYLRERLKVLPTETRRKWPFDDLCKNHMSKSEKEHKKKGLFFWSHRNSFRTNEKIIVLVELHEESAITGDEIYIPADGHEEIHHQSRMFIVPQDYYDKSRTIFQFYNLEYLEADGHFILRIISSNARWVFFHSIGSIFLLSLIVVILFQQKFFMNCIKFVANDVFFLIK